MTKILPIYHWLVAGEACAVVPTSPPYITKPRPLVSLVFGVTNHFEKINEMKRWLQLMCGGLFKFDICLMAARISQATQ